MRKVSDDGKVAVVEFGGEFGIRHNRSGCAAGSSPAKRSMSTT